MLHLLQQVMGAVKGIRISEAMIIAMIGGAAVITGAYIQSRDPAGRNAKRFLKALIREERAGAGREPVFFEAVTSRETYLAYQKAVALANIRPVNVRTGQRAERLDRKRSAVITGGAGIGKTFLSERLFEEWSGSLLGKLRSGLGESYCVKTTFRALVEEEPLQNALRNLRCRRLCLIVDGFDELSEKDETVRAGMGKLVSLWNSLGGCRHKSIFLFGRTAFADQYLQANTALGGIFDEVYRLEDWPEECLAAYEDRLLTFFVKDSRRREALRAFLKDPLIRACIDRNPLRLKMMLYICINAHAQSGGDKSLWELKEQYAFYTRFSECLIRREWNRGTGAAVSDGELREILNAHAGIAFDLFRRREPDLRRFCLPRRITEAEKSGHGIWDSPVFSALLRVREEGGQRRYAYIHKTFEEYFVARNLHERLKTAGQDSPEGLMALAEALMIPYGNDHADFITSGFRLLSGGETTIAYQKMERIYRSSCPPPSGRRQDAGDRQLRRFMGQLDDRSFLHLKYEIVFFAGRLKREKRETDGRLEQAVSGEFLRRTYQEDDLTQYQDRHYTEYQSTILKRCCAISASLIGDEETETDYIRKMIPGWEGYVPSYDLVNRSHTLIYYHDVARGDIFDYQDCDPAVAWSNAREHRIRRLRRPPDGPDGKYTHFRAFDLATIYTFLVDRGAGPEALTAEERQILRDCQVDIPGVSREKLRLMAGLKAEILRLLDR